MPGSRGLVWTAARNPSPASWDRVDRVGLGFAGEEMAPASALCILGPASGLAVLAKLSSDRASNQCCLLRATQGGWDTPYGQRYLPGAGPVELPADSQEQPPDVWPVLGDAHNPPPSQSHVCSWCSSASCLASMKQRLVLWFPATSQHLQQYPAHSRGLINAWVKNSLAPHLSFRFLFICFGCTGSSLPHESFL